MCNEVLVKIVVKRVFRLHVEGGEVVVTAAERTVFSTGGGEGGIDVGVVVNVTTEVDASCFSDCVSSRERSHVSFIEIFSLEHGDESREIGIRWWKVRVGAGKVSSGCIPTSKTDSPCRSIHRFDSF